MSRSPPPPVPRLVELLSAKMTALVNPSSSIALGALTLIVTPALLAATVPATLKPEGMALPLGTRVDGALIVDAEELVVEEVTLGGVGMNGVGIFILPVEVLILPDVALFCVNDGLEIRLISGNKGILL